MKTSRVITIISGFWQFRKFDTAGSDIVEQVNTNYNNNTKSGITGKIQ